MKRLAMVAVAVVLMGCTTSGYYQMLGGYDPANLHLGMTTAEVLEVENRPDKINKSRTEHGTRSQWVYHVGQYDTQYLYFEDGILVQYDEW